MDYIKEDTAFETWCENNYLPILSQAIWKKLFKRFNRSGWSEWVTVDNQSLMSEIQVRREATFIEYRDKLIEAGLIEFVKGKKGSPNRYRLVSLRKYTFTGEVQSVVESVVYPEVQSVVESVAQTADINKQNKTKYSGDDDGVIRAGAGEHNGRLSGDPVITPDMLFERYLGIVPTENEREHCQTLISRLDPDVLETAFHKAGISPNKNFGYVLGILKNYRSRGIKDMGDVAEDDLRHERDKRK